MRRVLISHSWAHSDLLTRLFALLERHQYDFYDHSITGDAPLPDMPTPDLKAELSRRIEQVSTVVVLATEDVHKRPFVIHEIAEAVRLGKRIVAVKPLGQAAGPVPRLIDQHAHAIVGFRGEQIGEAIDGKDIRNLAEYRIAESEDLTNLAHWVVRGTAGVVIVGALTAGAWLPRLNSLLSQHGVRLRIDGVAPEPEEVIERALVGALLGAGIGLLVGDARLAGTLALVGGGIGAGSALATTLTVRVLPGCGLFEARYMPVRNH